MYAIRVLSITFTGLFVVFVGLILLIFIFYIMGKIGKNFHDKDNIKTETPIKKETLAQTQNDNKKVVAAIMGAISIYYKDKPFKIKKIEKQTVKRTRTLWGQTSIIKLTNNKIK